MPKGNNELGVICPPGPAMAGPRKPGAAGSDTPAISIQDRFERHRLAKYYLYGVIKLLILIVVLYMGYRLFVGPPLLKQRNQEPAKKGDDDDGYADYEEIS